MLERLGKFVDSAGIWVLKFAALLLVPLVLAVIVIALSRSLLRVHVVILAPPASDQVSKATAEELAARFQRCLVSRDQLVQDFANCSAYDMALPYTVREDELLPLLRNSSASVCLLPATPELPQVQLGDKSVQLKQLQDLVTWVARATGRERIVQLRAGAAAGSEAYVRSVEVAQRGRVQVIDLPQAPAELPLGPDSHLDYLLAGTYLALLPDSADLRRLNPSPAEFVLLLRGMAARRSAEGGEVCCTVGGNGASIGSLNRSAGDYFSRAVRLAPRSPLAHFLYAQALWARGSDGIRQYREARAGAVQTVEAELAAAAAQQGLDPAGRRELTSALQSTEPQLPAEVRTAAHRLHAGGTSRRRAAWRQRLNAALDTAVRAARVHNERLGRCRLAVSELEAAYELSPPQLRAWRSRILVSLGTARWRMAGWGAGAGAASEVHASYFAEADRVTGRDPYPLFLALQTQAQAFNRSAGQPPAPHVLCGALSQRLGRYPRLGAYVLDAAALYGRCPWAEGQCRAAAEASPPQERRPAAVHRAVVRQLRRAVIEAKLAYRLGPTTAAREELLETCSYAIALDPGATEAYLRLAGSLRQDGAPQQVDPTMIMLAMLRGDVDRAWTCSCRLVEPLQRITPAQARAELARPLPAEVPLQAALAAVLHWTGLQRDYLPPEDAPAVLVRLTGGPWPAQQARQHWVRASGLLAACRTAPHGTSAQQARRTQTAKLLTTCLWNATDDAFRGYVCRSLGPSASSRDPGAIAQAYWTLEPPSQAEFLPPPDSEGSDR